MRKRKKEKIEGERLELKERVKEIEKGEWK